MMRRRRAALFGDTEAIGQLFGMIGVWAVRLRIPWPSSHTPLEHAAEFDSKLPEAALAVDHIASLFVAQRYGRQRPSSEILAGVVQDWHALQPRLWRRWLGETLGASEGKPGKGK